MSRYFDLFLAESREHLTASYRLLERLAAPADAAEPLRELLRHAHSMKGMSATMGYSAMVDRSHALEDLVQGLDAGAPLDREEHLPLIQDSLDALSRMVDEFERGRREKASLAATRAPGALWRVELELAPRPGGAASRTVALLGRLAELGRVLHATTPVTAAGGGPSAAGTERLRVLLDSQHSPDELDAALSSLGGIAEFGLARELQHDGSPAFVRPEPRWVRVRSDLLDRLVEKVQDLRLEQVRLRHALPAATRPPAPLERADLLAKEIQASILELRLLPFESVGYRLHRAVAELSRELSRPVQLEIEGADVRVDRQVLDALVDPLLHMLRNAIDHGIEPAEERARKGKPPRGTLRILLERSGDRLELSVEDDGRGLAPDELRRAAIERGLVDPATADNLAEREVLMLITLPGFTTAAEVTRVSGRGVGLDVVRDAVERLGGILEIESRPGTGTCLRLSVPSSLTLLQALLVRCGGELFALPLPLVEKAVAGDSARLPPLAARLGLGSRPRVRDACRLVVQSGPRRIDIVVDEVLGRREIVLRPLQPPLSLLRQYSGAAVLEDGSIVLALDPAHL